MSTSEIKREVRGHLGGAVASPAHEEERADAEGGRVGCRVLLDARAGTLPASDPEDERAREGPQRRPGSGASPPVSGPRRLLLPSTRPYELKGSG